MAAPEKPTSGRSMVSGDLLQFLIPSLIGVILFMIPVNYGGQITLVLGIIIDLTKKAVGAGAVPIVVALLGISAVASTAAAVRPARFQGYWRSLFVVTPFMLGVRIAALVLSIMVYLKLGPEWIWSKNTGGLMLNDLMTNLVPFFLWAGLFLTLLTDYGMMEFIGTVMRPLMRPLFRVPGRAAIDAAASWIGSGTVGVVITDQQYRQGFYTGREAIAISTGFSVVSLPIVILFTGFLKIPELFVQIYGTLIVVGLITNMIMSRIPPISRKPDTYWDEAPNKGIHEEIPKGVSLRQWALQAAVARAKEHKSDNIAVRGLKVIGDIWFGLEPIVMVMGVIVTVLAEYTPIFNWISMPFIPLLNLLGLSDAVVAAPTLVVGFADVFLPFILGAAIVSVKTKFVIAVVALVQIIFMTEIGALLLKSPIPVNVVDLGVIFLERTLIALPLATIAAMFLF